MLEGNPNLFMHLLNGVIPPQDRKEVYVLIDDVKDSMWSHFECLALVRYGSFPCKSHFYIPLTF